MRGALEISDHSPERFQRLNDAGLSQVNEPDRVLLRMDESINPPRDASCCIRDLKGGFFRRARVARFVALIRGTKSLAGLGESAGQVIDQLFRLLVESLRVRLARGRGTHF